MIALLELREIGVRLRRVRRGIGGEDASVLLEDAPAERSMDFMNRFPAERFAMVTEAPPPKASKSKMPSVEDAPLAEPPLL